MVSCYGMVGIVMVSCDIMTSKSLPEVSYVEKRTFSFFLFQVSYQRPLNTVDNETSRGGTQRHFIE